EPLGERLDLDRFGAARPHHRIVAAVAHELLLLLPWRVCVTRQSPLSPAALMTGAHLARSLVSNAASASGVPPAGSSPCCSSCWRVAGRARILASSAFS